MKIKLTQKGSFKNTEKLLARAKALKVTALLRSYGQTGVAALAAATPVESGETAGSWQYSLETSSTGYKLVWFNTHVNNGVPIAIIIQYGHGTGTGGYVPPRDYINPAIRPIMEKISAEIQQEVSSL